MCLGGSDMCTRLRAQESASRLDWDDALEYFKGTEE